MPSKLVKYCFKPGSGLSLSFGLLALTVLIGAPQSWATMTVTPTRLPDYNYLSNVVGTTAYYPAYLDGNISGVTAVPAVGTIDSSSNLNDVVLDQLNLNWGRGNNGGVGGDTDTITDNAVIFTVYSDKTTMTPPTFTNDTATLFLYATTSVNGRAQAVPIAFVATNSNPGTQYQCVVGGNVNTATGACGLSSRGGGDGNTYAYGVPYQVGQRMQIGIYPKDVCAATGGSSVTGCAATNVTGLAGPPTPSNASMNFTFNLVWLPGAVVTAFAGASTTDLTQAVNGNTPTAADTAISLTATFQNVPPTLDCTSVTSSSQLANQIYFPADEAILVNTTLFSMTPPSGLAASAPANKFIVAGNYGTSPNSATVDLTSNYASANSVIQRLALGATDTRAGNFLNSDSNTSYYYDIGFMFRDAAGFVTTSPTACTLQNVRTTAINGFLNKNACFIATAAYGGTDGATVTMLRVFRDKILKSFHGGRSFVHWYYSWSPGAADWIRAHSVFRYPVQVALFPLVVFAWFCLHPLALVALVSFMSVLLGGAFWMHRKSHRESLT